MIALLYPTGPGPTATSENPWLALAITGAVLVALVLSAWAVMIRRRPEKTEEPAGHLAKSPRAA